MSHQASTLHIIKTGFYNSQFVYRQVSVSPERTTECYEFEYFPENGGISYVNHKPFPIEQGNVLTAAPGCIRYSKLHFKAYYIHFATENEELNALLKQLPYVSSPGDASLQIEHLFKQVIQNMHQNDPSHKLLAEAKLLELIYRLTSRNTAENSKKAYSPLVLQAIEYIDRNYKENITLESIALAVGLTPVYLHKLFLKSTGQTPHERLIAKRLAAAKELLAGSDLKLIDVALESGFSSQSYFNAVFKKHFKVTPLAFRQKAFEQYQL